MKMKNIFYGITLITGLFFASCGTVPKEKDLPLDMTVTDLIQKAQECFDVNNYRGVKAYYEIIVKRFGTDLAVRTSAEYEIAHVLVKQKKWHEADILLSAIIARYQEQGGMLLPAQFYKLAQVDYAKVQEKIKHKKKTTPPKPEANDENVKLLDNTESNTD